MGALHLKVKVKICPEHFLHPAIKSLMFNFLNYQKINRFVLWANASEKITAKPISALSIIQNSYKSSFKINIEFVYTNIQNQSLWY